MNPTGQLNPKFTTFFFSQNNIFFCVPCDITLSGAQFENLSEWACLLTCANTLLRSVFVSAANPGVRSHSVGGAAAPNPARLQPRSR